VYTFFFTFDYTLFPWGRRCHDQMVVEFTTTYAIIRGMLDITLCDKGCQ